MLPIVAIVGRPNVGKSTLFNRLVKKRNALVDDIPGVTRDRLYATIEWDDRNLTIVDTGGFDSSHGDGISNRIKEQVETAIEEADFVILLFDGKTGPMMADEELIMLLRHSGKKVVYADEDPEVAYKKAKKKYPKKEVVLWKVPQGDTFIF